MYLTARRIRRRHLLVGATLTVPAFLLAACGGPALRGQEMTPPTLAPDFTLTDQHREPFTLSAQRGNAISLFFGYTHCPDVCPTTLATDREVEQKLGADAARVRFLFVTVDPQRDTPDVLRRHLAQFSLDFIGLTGTEAQLDPVYRAYGIYHAVSSQDSASGYLVSHTSNMMLIDPQGRWRVTHNFGDSGDDIAADFRTLLH